MKKGISRLARVPVLAGRLAGRQPARRAGIVHPLTPAGGRAPFRARGERRFLEGHRRDPPPHRRRICRRDVPGQPVWAAHLAHSRAAPPVCAAPGAAPRRAGQLLHPARAALGTGRARARVHQHTAGRRIVLANRVRRRAQHGQVAFGNGAGVPSFPARALSRDPLAVDPAVFLSTASTAIGLAWKSGVAAEVLSHPAFSMGKALYESKIYLETPDLFAWTLLVVVFSMLFEHCFRRLFARAAAQTR